jgi:hypothetical protein
MIQNEVIAREISELMVEYGRRLNESVARVQQHCSNDELKVYRIAVGKVMGEMLLEIMNPLYAEHPNLKPVGLK